MKSFHSIKKKKNRQALGGESEYYIIPKWSFLCSKNISVQSLLKYSKFRINQIYYAYGINGSSIILNALGLCFDLLVCHWICNCITFAAMRVESSRFSMFWSRRFHLHFSSISTSNAVVGISLSCLWPMKLHSWRYQTHTEEICNCFSVWDIPLLFSCGILLQSKMKDILYWFCMASL